MKALVSIESHGVAFQKWGVKWLGQMQGCMRPSMPEATLAAMRGKHVVSDYLKFWSDWPACGGLSMLDTSLPQTSKAALIVTLGLAPEGGWLVLSRE